MIFSVTPNTGVVLPIKLESLATIPFPNVHPLIGTETVVKRGVHVYIYISIYA